MVNDPFGLADFTVASVLPDIHEGDLVLVRAYGQERQFLVTRRRPEDGGGITLEVLADPEDPPVAGP
jgi:hypothetical protein